MKNALNSISNDPNIDPAFRNIFASTSPLYLDIVEEVDDITNLNLQNVKSEKEIRVELNPETPFGETKKRDLFHSDLLDEVLWDDREDGGRIFTLYHKMEELYEKNMEDPEGFLAQLEDDNTDSELIEVGLTTFYNEDEIAVFALKMWNEKYEAIERMKTAIEVATELKSQS